MTRMQLAQRKTIENIIGLNIRKEMACLRNGLGVGGERVIRMFVEWSMCSSKSSFKGDYG